MTQEEKKLLLKDLSARLLYGIIIQVYYEDIAGSGYFDETVWTVDNDEPFHINDRCIENIKPYLRPISSMTEEEQVELGKLIGTASYNMLKGDMSHLDALLVHIYKNHIDAFGLIPQGLALEAPKEMYNIKEK